MATAALIEHQEQTLKDEAEIRAVIERLHQAHYDKDVRRLLRLTRRTQRYLTWLRRLATRESI